MGVNKYSIDEKFEIASLYEKGESPKNLALKYSIDKSTVFEYLKIFGIKPKGNTQKIHKCNVNIFKNVDNQEKAYWLGFIAADGNISKNELKITLAHKDKDHLIKFCKFIDLQTPIKEINNNGYPAVSVNIGSIEMAKDLLNYGITPNKTLTLTFPNNLDMDLIQHYIRGYFDGDGSAYVKGEYKTPVVSFVGNKEFIKCLSLLIEVFCGIITPIYKHSKSENVMYATISGDFRVKIFCDWLYKNESISMTRKKEIVNSFKTGKRNMKAMNYAGTVGHVAEDTVKKYIENQKNV
jgi:hypothetical protein